MKIWRLYQRLLCKWFLKSLWIIYSEVYLKQEMTYSCIVSCPHTVIYFFFPGYLKGGSKLWVRRKPRDKQGQQSGYRGDVKTQPGNKHPTNNRYNKTGWMKSLSGVLTWDLFPVNVKVFQEFHLKTELTLQAKVFWRYVPVLGMDGGLTLACKEFQTFYRILCAFNPWQQFFFVVSLWWEGFSHEKDYNKTCQPTTREGTKPPWSGHYRLYGG